MIGKRANFDTRHKENIMVVRSTRARFGEWNIVMEGSVDRKRDQWRRIGEEDRPRLSASLLLGPKKSVLLGPKKSEAREMDSNHSSDRQQNSWSREGLAVFRWIDLVLTLNVVGQAKCGGL